MCHQSAFDIAFASFSCCSGRCTLRGCVEQWGLCASSDCGWQAAGARPAAQQPELHLRGHAQRAAAVVAAGQQPAAERQRHLWCASRSEAAAHAAGSSGPCSRLVNSPCVAPACEWDGWAEAGQQKSLCCLTYRQLWQNITWLTKAEAGLTGPPCLVRQARPRTRCS